MTYEFSEWIKSWLIGCSFRTIKIGERFKLPGDPNIYQKISSNEGNTAMDRGLIIVCQPGTRVLRWPWDQL